MQEIIIHIGRHKSGTSTLQHFLHLNRETLKGNGWLYPETGCKPIAHHGLTRYLLSLQNNTTPSDPDIFHELMGEIKDWDGRVLISSEGFQNIDPQNLAKEFKGYPVRIVIYLREQLEYLLSTYGQGIHEHKEWSSLEKMEKYFFADYSSFLEKWSEAFGQENLLIGIYDRKELRNGTIIDDFVSLVNLPDSEYQIPQKERNPSIGGALLEFKRRFNKNIDWDKKTIRKMLYQPLTQLARENKLYREKPVVSEKFAQYVRKKYEDSNRKVLLKYFPSHEYLFNMYDFPTGRQTVGYEEQFREIAGSLLKINPDLPKNLYEIIMPD